MSRTRKTKERARPAVEKSQRVKPIQHLGALANWCVKCGYHRTGTPKPSRCPKCGGLLWTTRKGYDKIEAWRAEQKPSEPLEPDVELDQEGAPIIGVLEPDEPETPAVIPDQLYQYWVNLGIWKPDQKDLRKHSHVSFLERFLKAGGAIEHQFIEGDPEVRVVDDYGRMTLVTQDLSKARRIAKGAIDACLENGFDPSVVAIVRHTICPMCHELAIFTICMKCGTELEVMREIPIDEGE